MSHPILISYAQNGEDIVLWRALGHVHGGVFVDVGGWDPDAHSVTRLFSENGWRGINIEPIPEFAERFRERRLRDEVVEAAISDSAEEELVLHRFSSTGLSTLVDKVSERHVIDGRDHEAITVASRRLDEVLETSEIVRDTIHFLKIDVEGAEGQVLRSVDLHRWRPWVLVVEATEPNSTKATHEEWDSLIIDAGYTMTLFDGLSRFYVSTEHPELVDKLSYPACVLDGYKTAEQADVEARLAQAQADLGAAMASADSWRGRVVTVWADAVERSQEARRAALVADRRAQRGQQELQKLRSRLRSARAEQQRLRARVERLTARQAQMRSRLEQQDQLFEVRARRSARRILTRVRGS